MARRPLIGTPPMTSSGCHGSNSCGGKERGCGVLSPPMTAAAAVTAAAAAVIISPCCAAGFDSLSIPTIFSCCIHAGHALRLQSGQTAALINHGSMQW